VKVTKLEKQSQLWLPRPDKIKVEIKTIMRLLA
jgi:hypothetical protein